MAPPRRPLGPLGRDHAGLVTRRQLLDAGFSASAVRRSSSTWPVLLPGVLWTTPSAEVAALLRSGQGRGRGPGQRSWFEDGLVPWEVRARAVLMRWPQARLAGTSAAHVDGWADEPHGVTALLPTGCRGTAPVGVTLRRERPGVRLASRPADLRRTRAEDTVVDILQEVPAGNGEAVFTWLERCLGARGTTPGRLLAVVRSRGALRHRRELTEALEDLAHGTASHLERRYTRDVHGRHGLPSAHQQAPVASGVPRRGAFADVAYRGPGVLVELDGRLGHAGEGALRDRRRDNANTLAGWATLRFGWHDVVGDPCAVARDVGQVLTARGWSGAVRPCSPGCARRDAA